jgi:protein-disulfide isomerase
MHTHYRLVSMIALALMALLSACAAQPQPTATPEATLDTTALAQGIADSIFGTLTAQPTNTLAPSATATPSPTVTTTLTPSPDVAGTALANFAGRIEEQQAAIEEIGANLPATVIAQLPTGQPSLDANALAATVQAGAVRTLRTQFPTPAPTLDMEVLVGTAQAGVIETLVANVTQQVAQQSTLQAAQQASQTAVAVQPADVSADDDPFWGPEDAKVTIIEFSDYSCPHCRDFALDTLPRLKTANSERVRFVFRASPILGPASGWAALAAECADDQGKFWEYHDLLFANQGSLSRENLTLYAQQLDLNIETFDACVDNQTYIDELRNDLADAQNAGVSGTPTFFINGQRIVGAQPYELFVQVIDEELAKVGLPTGPAAATEEATEAGMEVATEEVAVEPTAEVVIVMTATATLSPTAASAGVEMVEVVGAGDLTAEAVTFRNNGATINLNGWTLSDDAGHTYTFGERRIFTGGQMSLFTREGQDTAVALFWNQTTALYSPGTVLTLRDQNKTAQSTFRVP